MKYTAVSAFCLALAGIIVIYHFRPSNQKTPITSRKIAPIEQKKYNLAPVVHKNIIPRVQTENSQEQLETAKPDIVKFAQNLRTTYVDGIYCQKVADDGTYKNQKHYFYNQKTEKFVEIPNVYFINNLETLGDLKEEFLHYGAKTNTIIYKGQHIKIWTMK